MAIKYKRIRAFVWLNGLVSNAVYPFLRIIDYRKTLTSEVQILEKPHPIVIDHSHLHFEGNAYWKGFETFQGVPLFYVVVPQASIISKGIVLDSQNRVIMESTLFQKEYLNILCSNHLIFLKNFLPQRRETNVISLLNKLDNNYFHWTTESLTRILLIHDKLFFKEYKILVKHEALPFIKTSLNFLFDIPEENIIAKTLGENLEVDNALVISFPHIRNSNTHFTNVYLPDILRKLNALAHRKLESRFFSFSKTPTNFIISRKNALERKILNEDRLIHALAEYDFKSIALEELDYIEQVVLFFRAEVIIATHGAGIANIIYAKQPLLIEVFPEERNIRDAFYFTQITAALGIEHHLFLQKQENEKEDLHFNEALIEKMKRVIGEFKQK